MECELARYVCIQSIINEHSYSQYTYSLINVKSQIILAINNVLTYMTGICMDVNKDVTVKNDAC